MPKPSFQQRPAGTLVLLAFAAAILSVPWAAAQEVGAPREAGRIRTRDLSEISGLAASRRTPDVLWLHNDGDRAEVFAVSTDGKLVARVRVSAKVEDVEDIAIGPGSEQGVDYIYLGDIGDNDESRREVRVIRFAEPALDSGDAKIKASEVDEFRLRYADGRHDAEALLVDPLSGDLFVVTKDDERSRLYRASADSLRSGGGPIMLEAARILNVKDVSAGDISPAGDWVLLRDEERGWLWSRGGGESVADAFQRAPRRVFVRGRGQSENGEAVGFRGDGRSYYTVSEGEHEPVYVFPLPAGVGGGVGTAR